MSPTKQAKRQTQNFKLRHYPRPAKTSLQPDLARHRGGHRRAGTGAHEPLLRRGRPRVRAPCPPVPHGVAGWVGFLPRRSAQGAASGIGGCGQDMARASSRAKRMCSGSHRMTEYRAAAGFVTRGPKFESGLGCVKTRDQRRLGAVRRDDAAESARAVGLTGFRSPKGRWRSWWRQRAREDDVWGQQPTPASRRSAVQCPGCSSRG